MDLLLKTANTNRPAGGCGASNRNAAASGFMPATETGHKLRQAAATVDFHDEAAGSMSTIVHRL
jgi:hypothetical protein